MKRLLIIIASFALVFGQDMSPVGQWKLSGLRVDYYDIARQDAVLAVSDAYGFGISVPLASIPAGALFNTTINGPFTNQTLQLAGLNLNVNVYPDGTGAIGEGSYYPDVDLIPGTCITQGLIFPITDNFNWNAPGNQADFPAQTIIGTPSANAAAGTYAEGFGVNGSGVFDNWPATPVHIPIPYVLPAIATADGLLAVSCGAACTTPDAAFGGMTAADAMFGGDVATCVAACTDPTAFGLDPMAFGGAGMLPGQWGGQYSTEPRESQMPGNDANDVKFLLEWNAIDGWESESGLGDDLTVDEDGDGTEYDRIFGVPYISSTTVDASNPLCDITGGALTGAGGGLTYPVAGDIVAALGGADAVGALVTGECINGTTALCEAAGGAAEVVWAGCMDAVVPSVEGLCDAAGSPQAAVAGLCFDTSQDPGLLATCQYAGVNATVVGACMQLGFDAEICADAGGIATAGIADACESGVIAGAEAACEGAGGLFNTLYGGCLQQGGDEATCAAAATEGAAAFGDSCAAWASYTYAGATCEDAGTTDCDVLVSEAFATEMCTFIGYTLTESETCNEWAWSVADGFAAQSAETGYQTCTQAAEAATGLPMGAGTEYCGAAADALFALQTGMSCSDYGANYVGMCVTGVSGANTFYVMDPVNFGTWGMFLTYNGASVSQYLAAGYDMATIMGYFPELFVNDSASDFDPSCYYTGETCGGRLVMNFEPTCVPEVEAHQIIAEFVDLTALECEATGDVAGGFEDLACQYNPESANGDGSYGSGYGYDSCTCEDDDGDGALEPEELCFGDGYYDTEFEAPGGDGVTNVVDIVRLVGHIVDVPLGGYGFCAGDMNADGFINVVDVVAVVQIVLGSARVDDASETTIQYTENKIELNSNGYVGGIDITVEFKDESFSFELADNFYQRTIIDGNTARILMFADESGIDEVLNVTQGAIVSVSDVIVANSSEEVANVTYDQILPQAYVIKNAYPNPFNPVTTLSVELNTAADVSVKVYNLTGQLVDVIAQGNFSPNTYNWTWNAENLASGVYFIATQIGNDINNQKVMLIK